MAKNNPAKLKPEDESILTFSIALWLQNKGFPNVLKRFLFAAQIEDEDWKAKALNLNEIFSQYQEIRNSAHEVLKYPKQEEQVVETTEKNGDANAATSNEIQSKKTEEKSKRDITVNETGIAHNEKVKKSYINSNEDDEYQSAKASKESNGVPELAEDQSSKKQIEVVSEVTELKNFAAELPDGETTVDKKSKKRSHEAAEDGTNESKKASKNRKILAPNENENQPAQEVEVEVEQSKSKMSIGLEEGKDVLQQKGEAFESDQVGSQKFSAKQSDDDSSKNAVANGMDNLSQRKSANKQPKSSEMSEEDNAPSHQAFGSGSGERKKCGSLRPSVDDPRLRMPPPSQPSSTRSAPSSPASQHLFGSLSCSQAGVSSSSSSHQHSVATRDHRLPIRIENQMIVPGHEASVAITTSILSLVIAPGAYCWSKVPKQKRLEYFEKFKKACVWDRSIFSNELVYKKFCRLAETRYRAIMYKWRGLYCRDGIRQPLDDTLWNSLTVVWDDPEYKARCQKNKANRKSDQGGRGVARHRGGSRSIYEQGLAIERKMGRPLTHMERLNIAHPFDVDTQTSTCVGTTNLHLNLKRRIAEAQTQVPLNPEVGSSQPPSAVDVDQIYLETAGVNRGNVLGLGRMSSDVKSAYQGSQASESSAVSEPPPDVQQYVHRFVRSMGRVLGMTHDQMQQVIADTADDCRC